MELARFSPWCWGTAVLGVALGIAALIHLARAARNQGKEPADQAVSATLDRAEGFLKSGKPALACARFPGFRMVVLENRIVDLSRGFPWWLWATARRLDKPSCGH